MRLPEMPHLSEEKRVQIADDLVIAAKNLRWAATIPFLPQSLQAFFDRGGTFLAGKIGEMAKAGIERTEGNVLPEYNDWQNIAKQVANLLPPREPSQQ